MYQLVVLAWLLVADRVQPVEVQFRVGRHLMVEAAVPVFVIVGFVAGRIWVVLLLVLVFWNVHEGWRSVVL